MILYQEFLALNELAAFDPCEKLRWAVHEIIIKLKSTEEIKFDILSKRLKDEYKIDISTELLKELFTAWDRFQDPDFSFFKKDDKNWMEVWPYAGYVKKKSRDKQNFGKHRKKDITYTTGSAYGYGTGTKWVNGRWVKNNDKDVESRYPYGGQDYYGD